MNRGGDFAHTNNWDLICIDVYGNRLNLSQREKK